MIRPAKKPLFSRLLALIPLLFLPCVPLQALPTEKNSGITPVSQESRTQAETEALRLDFLKLKKKFEQNVKRIKEQKILITMAVESAADSWALAAAFIGADEKTLRLKKSALDKAASSRNWDTHEMAALEYYYEAIAAMTREMARSKSQAPLLTELDSITAKTAEQAIDLEGKPDGALEKRVVFSGALTGLVSVAVKSVGGGAMEKPIQLIVKDMLSKAHAISDRPDIHYRAKLSLLYANNVHSLTALTFLLGHNAGPPLSSELAKVHNAWNTHVRDASLPDSLSLTWTAQCQAVLPLSFWLATQ